MITAVELPGKLPSDVNVLILTKYHVLQTSWDLIIMQSVRYWNIDQTTNKPKLSIKITIINQQYRWFIHQILVTSNASLVSSHWHPARFITYIFSHDRSQPNERRRYLCIIPMRICTLIPGFKDVYRIPKCLFQGWGYPGFHTGPIRVFYDYGERHFALETILRNVATKKTPHGSITHLLVP